MVTDLYDAVAGADTSDDRIDLTLHQNVGALGGFSWVPVGMTYGEGGNPCGPIRYPWPPVSHAVPLLEVGNSHDSCLEPECGMKGRHLPLFIRAAWVGAEECYAGPDQVQMAPGEVEDPIGGSSMERAGLNPLSPCSSGDLVKAPDLLWIEVGVFSQFGKGSSNLEFRLAPQLG